MNWRFWQKPKPLPFSRTYDLSGLSDLHDGDEWFFNAVQVDIPSDAVWFQTNTTTQKDGYAHFGETSRIWRLRLSNGQIDPLSLPEKNWRYCVPDGRGHLYLVLDEPNYGTVLQLDTQTGSVRDMGLTGVQALDAVGDRLVIVVPDERNPYIKYIKMLDATTGNVLWSITLPSKVYQVIPFLSETTFWFLLYAPTIYAVASNHNGRLKACYPLFTDDYRLRVCQDGLAPGEDMFTWTLFTMGGSFNPAVPHRCLMIYDGQFLEYNLDQPERRLQYDYPFRYYDTWPPVSFDLIPFDADTYLCTQQDDQKGIYKIHLLPRAALGKGRIVKPKRPKI